MRQLSLFLGFLSPAMFLCSTACGPGTAAKSPLRTPWLAVSEMVHDFGEIPHGQSRTHQFTIDNRGPQRVRLTGIRNQCTCAITKVRLLRDGQPIDRPVYNPPRQVDGGFLMATLEPGERLAFEVKVDTRLRPPRDHKEQALSQLHFEPAEEAGVLTLAYRFTIRSRVRIISDLAPSMNPTIDLGDFSKDQEVYSVLELAPLKEPFHLLSVTGDGDGVVLEKREPKNKGGYRYGIRVAPRGKAGPFDRLLGFKTDIDHGYLLQIQLVGNALPNLQVTPHGRLDFGRFDWRQPTERFVTIVYRRPRFDPKLAVDSVDVHTRDGRDVSSLFEATIDGGGARRWTLSLKYKGGLKGKGFEGSVRFRSADPEQHVVVVPFTGYPNHRT